MTPGNRPETCADPTTVFSAVITPHRSLGQAGFFILMTAVALVSFAAGVVFLMIDAWPVFGFFGLDVLLLYWAFKINYRRAAAFEEVTVTPLELKIRKVNHRGRMTEWSANPLWVRIEQDADDEFGIEKLYLTSRGERIAVADFLGPDEKAELAKALGRALADARRVPAFSAGP